MKILVVNLMMLLASILLGALLIPDLGIFTALSATIVFDRVMLALLKYILKRKEESHYEEETWATE